MHSTVPVRVAGAARWSRHPHEVLVTCASTSVCVTSEPKADSADLHVFISERSQTLNPLQQGQRQNFCSDGINDPIIN